MGNSWWHRFFGRADRLLPLIGAVGIIIWTVGIARLFGLKEFTSGQLANLGAGVTSGGIVTWAVMALQRKSELLAQKREDQLRAELERRQLTMSLSLQNDLSGVTMVELDLRGLILSRKRFVGAVLRKCDLRGVRLDGANLADADLSDARLEDADLRGTVFTRSELSRAQLQRADLRGADLTGAILSGANCSDANLEGASLSGAHIKGTIWSGAKLRNTELSGVDKSDLPNIPG